MCAHPVTDLAKRGQLACPSIARSCFGNAYHIDLHPDAPQTCLAPDIPTGSGHDTCFSLSESLMGAPEAEHRTSSSRELFAPAFVPLLKFECGRREMYLDTRPDQCWLPK